MHPKKMSILLADTDQSKRETTFNILLVSGYKRVRIAKTANEIIKILSNTYFDLLLIDYRMFQSQEVKDAVINYHKSRGNKVFLMLDDDQQPHVNSVGKRDEIFPYVLKSFIGDF